MVEHVDAAQVLHLRPAPATSAVLPNPSRPTFSRHVRVGTSCAAISQSTARVLVSQTANHRINFSIKPRPAAAGQGRGTNGRRRKKLERDRELSAAHTGRSVEHRQPSGALQKSTARSRGKVLARSRTAACRFAEAKNADHGHTTVGERHALRSCGRERLRPRSRERAVLAAARRRRARWHGKVSGVGALTAASRYGNDARGAMHRRSSRPRHSR